ncbi:glycosyltransferase family 4 protein [Desulfatitalea tepidiphila]|uniref:glycosyltransferase family 4 protein n=1 Tax=Desulfatitalea tepidiphila TaxID=1185843 RepID=UPI0006B4831B|nr:glycosyltransferase family 4 protein [Desulfatitalea tepidiphila]
MRNKILFVEQTADGTIGGSHYCLLYLIQHLNKMQFEPIALFYESHSLIDTFKKECRTEIFHVKPFSKLRISVIRKVINLLINFFIVFKCLVYIKKNRIKIVHLNNSVSGGYFNWLVACALANIPCVTHERNFTNYPRTLFFRFMVKKYKKILPVSDVIAINIKRQGIAPEIVETVHDGISPDVFRNKIKKTAENIRVEFNIPSNFTIIGLIGNIRRWKGQELLIDALNLVNEEMSDFYCLLVGDTGKNSSTDTEFEKHLLNKITTHGLEHKVILTGYRNDIPDIINALDIQINASIKPDPFPHVILEGMSSGKPIIATNLGGAVESIEHGVSGFLVPPESEQIAEKILVLIKNSSIRKSISKNALLRVNKFTMVRTIEKIEKIYKGLLNQQ